MKPDVAKLRQTILQLAVEGKLVSQDNSDEPASELLKRIEDTKQKLIIEGKIRKNKPVPPITDTEKPFMLPESWKWVRFQDVLDVRDGTHDTPKYVENGVPLVTSKNLFTTGLNVSTAKYISQEDHQDIAKRSAVDVGDVLFAMIGTIGNPVIIKEAPNFSIKNVALFKHYKPDFVLSEFLHSYLRYATEHMKRTSAGSVQSFVSLGFLRTYIMPLPPVEEQRRIVAKVGELMAICDAIEAKSDDFLTTLTKLRQAILQLAVEGKLVPQDASEQPASELLKEIEAERQSLVADNRNPKSKPVQAINNEEKPYKIPSSWVWARIGSCTLSITGGNTPSKANGAYWNDGVYPWVTVKDLRDNKYIDDSRDHITDKAVSEAAKVVKAGSVIICTRMGLGKISIANRDIAINQDLKALQLSQFVELDYFYNYFKTLSIVGHGVTVNGISQDTLLGYMMPLPPLKEQKRIVAKIDELLAFCDELESKLSASTSF